MPGRETDIPAHPSAQIPICADRAQEASPCGRYPSWMTHDRTPELAAQDAVSAPAAAAAAEPELAPELREALRSFTNAQRAPRTRHEYEKYLKDFVRFAGISSRQELLGTKSDQVIEYRNALQA